MNPRRPRQASARRGRVVFALALAALLPTLPLTLPGCDRTPAPAAGPTHTVRAKVMGLPTANDPSSAFTLLHEDIPGWLAPDGSKGMHSMQMPFPVARGVSLDGVALGDKVEVTVRQFMSGPTPYEVSALRKLPPDTKLSIQE